MSRKEASELRYDLLRPCGSCPFLRSTPLHEGIARGLVDQYVWSIDQGTFSHSCHQTCADEKCDGNREYEGAEQHCVGAMAFLIKSRAECQMPHLKAIDEGRLPINRLADYETLAAECGDVYTLREMLSRYTDWLRQMTEAPNGRTLTRQEEPTP